MNDPIRIDAIKKDVRIAKKLGFGKINPQIGSRGMPKRIENTETPGPR